MGVPLPWSIKAARSMAVELLPGMPRVTIITNSKKVRKTISAGPNLSAAATIRKVKGRRTALAISSRLDQCRTNQRPWKTWLYSPRIDDNFTWKNPSACHSRLTRRIHAPGSIFRSLYLLPTRSLPNRLPRWSRKPASPDL